MSFKFEDSKHVKQGGQKTNPAWTARLRARLSAILSNLCRRRLMAGARKQINKANYQLYLQRHLALSFKSKTRISDMCECLWAQVHVDIATHVTDFQEKHLTWTYATKNSAHLLRTENSPRTGYSFSSLDVEAIEECPHNRALALMKAWPRPWLIYCVNNPVLGNLIRKDMGMMNRWCSTTIVTSHCHMLCQC